LWWVEDYRRTRGSTRARPTCTNPWLAVYRTCVGATGRETSNITEVPLAASTATVPFTNVRPLSDVASKSPTAPLQHAEHCAVPARASASPPKSTVIANRPLVAACAVIELTRGPTEGGATAGASVASREAARRFPMGPLMMLWTEPQGLKVDIKGGWSLCVWGGGGSICS
jgi:hypothetical protein